MGGELGDGGTGVGDEHRCEELWLEEEEELGDDDRWWCCPPCRRGGVSVSPWSPYCWGLGEEEERERDSDGGGY